MFKWTWSCWANQKPLHLILSPWTYHQSISLFCFLSCFVGIWKCWTVGATLVGWICRKSFICFLWMEAPIISLQLWVYRFLQSFQSLTSGLVLRKPKISSYFRLSITNLLRCWPCIYTVKQSDEVGTTIFPIVRHPLMFGSFEIRHPRIIKLAFLERLSLWRIEVFLKLFIPNQKA